MNLGKILKEERIKHGLSQQRLADAAGVTKRAIIYWENGKKKMNVERVLTRYLKHFMCPLLSVNSNSPN